MKTKYYISIISIFSFVIINAQIKEFKNKEYIKNGDNYEMLDVSNLEYYPIAKGIITLKYKPTVINSQIQNFEFSNNLTLIRKAATGWYDYQMLNGSNVFNKANLFLNNPLIEDVEIPKFGEYISTPNDLSYSNQWYLNQSNGININVENAWDLTTGNSNIIVGVLDSGTDWAHKDLGSGNDNYQNIYTNSGEDSWTNQNTPSSGNGIDDDGNGLIDDWKGWNFDNSNNDSRGPFYHGTHVAGIVGAKTNNNTGISGIAGGWNNEGVKMLICQLGDYNPNSAILDDAILYAAQMGVKIIQLSLGVPQSQAIDDALDMAHNDYGVTIICATGNGGSSTFIGYPSSNEFVISVGASTETNSRATFSNHGSNLFISAPGTNIFSTRFNNQYESGDGTSYSAPIVSGIVALMYSINPCLTNIQAKNILKQTANKVGGYDYNWNPSDIGHSLELGYGVVDAYAAVQMAQSMGSSTLDLYVKDSPDDDGTEPNTVTQHMWTSQDIWIRNSNDNGLTHQNPEYRTNGNPNYINIRVINKSCVSSTGNETLTINWAKANTALAWPQNWDGSLQNPLGFDLGNELASVSIPIIQAGAEAIVKIPWIVPNPDNYSDNNNPWHFCLLSRVNAADDPLTSPMTSNPNVMVRNNNNLAWKNLTVVDLVADRSSAMVMIANPSDTPKTFLLEFQRATNEGGKAIFEEAEVTLKMDDIIFNAWERGGKQAELLESKSDEKRKLVKGNNVILNNIMFEPNERGLLTLDFNFLTKELTEKTEFTYHVVQKDANTGEVIGGETFLIKKKSRPIFIANAGDDKELNENETITLSAEQINEAAIYNWYDTDGNLIYQGKDLTVSADVTKKYKLEIVAETDGYKDYDEIEVKLKPSILENISPNPTSNEIQISYKLNGVNSAYLMIIGQYGTNGTSNNYVLDTNSSQTTINVINYTNGFYTVALVCNGQIVDAKTLIKQ